MTAKRIFQVYSENHIIEVVTMTRIGMDRPWRFRVIAARNGQIVGGSQEAFDSKSNALRAARREASLYPPGIAEVQIEDEQPSRGRKAG